MWEILKRSVRAFSRSEQEREERLTLRCIKVGAVCSSSEQTHRLVNVRDDANLTEQVRHREAVRAAAVSPLDSLLVRADGSSHVAVILVRPADAEPRLVVTGVGGGFKIAEGSLRVLGAVRRERAGRGKVATQVKS